LNKTNFCEIINNFGGLKDIDEKILRTPLEPSKTFDDDPLRMMRAVRFASQLEFKIEPNTFNAIIKMKERLRILEDESGKAIHSVVSQERITDEFLKILMTPSHQLDSLSSRKAG
jgi:tRNA nucleotidyltransferase/poly(A) polymerase